jgi:hypothetical protein
MDREIIKSISIHGLTFYNVKIEKAGDRENIFIGFEDCDHPDMHILWEIATRYNRPVQIGAKIGDDNYYCQSPIIMAASLPTGVIRFTIEPFHAKSETVGLIPGWGKAE